MLVCVCACVHVCVCVCVSCTILTLYRVYRVERRHNHQIQQVISQDHEHNTHKSVHKYCYRPIPAQIQYKQQHKYWSIDLMSKYMAESNNQ